GFKSTKGFTLNVTGGSFLQGTIVADKIDGRVSGASRILLEGSGTDSTLEASGTSKLDLAKLSLEKLDICLSGKSTAAVSVKKTLNYEIGGESRLTYLGEPEIGRKRKTGAASAHREAKGLTNSLLGGEQLGNQKEGMTFVELGGTWRGK